MITITFCLRLVDGVFFFFFCTQRKKSTDSKGAKDWLTDLPLSPEMNSYWCLCFRSVCMFFLLSHQCWHHVCSWVVDRDEAGNLTQRRDASIKKWCYPWIFCTVSGVLLGNKVKMLKVSVFLKTISIDVAMIERSVSSSQIKVNIFRLSKQTGSHPNTKRLQGLNKKRQFALFSRVVYICSKCL